jgi:hypothetical protein
MQQLLEYKKTPLYSTRSSDSATGEMLTIPVLDLNFHVLFLLMAAPGAPSALA